MKPMKPTILLCAALLLGVFAAPARAGSIRTTKHNLSVSGPGTVTATSEERICIFCHIPHREDSSAPYLWSRSTPSQPYTPYASSTLKATVGQPTGSSRLCLSCHDGTIALGAVASSTTEIPFKGGMRFITPDRATHLGTNLSDDHPVSFVYDTTLSADNPQIRDPAILPPAMQLDQDRQLQCTTCHDPHDDTFGRFLVMDNTASAMCVGCHAINGWTTSAHARSGALLDRSGGLWPNTPYATVAENGCENCHRPHTAGRNERLLIFSFEEDNCLDCHNGGIATADIATVFAKPYTHPVNAYTGVHDAAEDFSSGAVPEHVECSDCHNAHQANEDPAVVPFMVSGATKGVSGISAGGTVVTEAWYIYQICFKCHADNNVIDTVSVPRQIEQLNTRLEFDPVNPSFHPVETRGKNPDVPSLLPPNSVGSVIVCTDCHGNDDPAQAPGPHGSQWPHLLTNRYLTADFTMESPSAYALCYSCHDRTSLLSNASFPHSAHVVDQQAPCSACHDPHGISAAQGTALRNSHLINFDLSIVSPSGTGQLEFNNLGRFQGQCFLTCHGHAHNPETYSQ